MSKLIENMNPVTDKAFCKIDLRNGCRAIAIFFFVCLAILAIDTPGYFTSFKTLIGLIVLLIVNIALLYGAELENKWLVLVWLFYVILFYICWPFVILGVISKLNVLLIIVYIISLIVHVFFTRIVFSYWYQLCNRDLQPQPSVAV